MPGGKNGFVIHRAPGEYPLNQGQKNMQEMHKFCNIRKGMSREELIQTMKTCVPEFWRQFKEKQGQEAVEQTPNPSPASTVKEGGENNA